MNPQQHTQRGARSHNRAPTPPRLLLLAVTVAAAISHSLPTAAAEERGVFKSGSYKADMTLTPASKSRKAGPNLTVGPVPAGVAWDGSSLWSAAGGAIDTVNLIRWSKSGKTVKASHTPNLDIRAIWTQEGTVADGGASATVLYADAYSDDKVYVRKQDGSFEATGVSLHGATKDTDSPVLYRPNSRTEDPAAGVLVAHDGAGALLEFDAADGMFVRDVPLNGYGSEPGETDWPAYTRFAVAHVGPGDRFFYLTYAGSRVHAWDAEGERVGGADLVGAGEDEMSCHSFSFANERAWVLDTTSGTWHGYKLTFEDPPKPKSKKQKKKVVQQGATATHEVATEGGSYDDVAAAASAPAGAASAPAEEVCPTAVV